MGLVQVLVIIPVLIFDFVFVQIFVFILAFKTIGEMAASFQAGRIYSRCYLMHREKL
jgi:hypothetical protein